MKKKEPAKEHTRHLWTKNDIRKLIDLWESKTIAELAEEIGCKESAVAFMAYQLRKEGFTLSRRKRQVGITRKLIKDVIDEYNQ